MKYLSPSIYLLLLVSLLGMSGCEINKENVINAPPDTTVTTFQVSVSPMGIVMNTGQTQQFTAQVVGTANTACSWSVESGPGSINTNGLYMPPDTVSGDTATVVIKAVLNADTRAFGRANVKVVNTEPVDPCDVVNVGFAAVIRPILQSNCTSCHSGPFPPENISLNTYAGAKAVADDGRLYGAISHASGFDPMPQGGTKLDDCSIRKIKSWIDKGAPND